MRARRAIYMQSGACQASNIQGGGACSRIANRVKYVGLSLTGVAPSPSARKKNGPKPTLQVYVQYPYRRMARTTAVANGRALSTRTGPDETRRRRASTTPGGRP